jgi:hypothetical protein
MSGGRLVVTALGAGQFTFEVVQRAAGGTSPAQVPPFAHVAKRMPVMWCAVQIGPPRCTVIARGDRDRGTPPLRGRRSLPDVQWGGESGGNSKEQIVIPVAARNEPRILPTWAK